MKIVNLHFVWWWSSNELRYMFGKFCALLRMFVLYLMKIKVFISPSIEPKTTTKIYATIRQMPVKLNECDAHVLCERSFLIGISHAVCRINESCETGNKRNERVSLVRWAELNWSVNSETWSHVRPMKTLLLQQLNETENTHNISLKHHRSPKSLFVWINSICLWNFRLINRNIIEDVVYVTEVNVKVFCFIRNGMSFFFGFLNLAKYFPNEMRFPRVICEYKILIRNKCGWFYIENTTQIS